MLTPQSANPSPLHDGRAPRNPPVPKWQAGLLQCTGYLRWELSVGLCCWKAGCSAARSTLTRTPCWWIHTYHPFLLPKALHLCGTSKHWGSWGKGRLTSTEGFLHTCFSKVSSAGGTFDEYSQRDPIHSSSLSIPSDHPHPFPQTSLSSTLWSCSFQISEYPGKLLATGTVQATSFIVFQVTTKYSSTCSKFHELGRFSFFPLSFRATSLKCCRNISVYFQLMLVYCASTEFF